MFNHQVRKNRKPVALLSYALMFAIILSTIVPAHVWAQSVEAKSTPAMGNSHAFVSDETTSSPTTPVHTSDVSQSAAFSHDVMPNFNVTSDTTVDSEPTETLPARSAFNPIAPTIAITDTAIIPDSMTIEEGTTVVIRNDSERTRNVKISKTAGLVGGTAVYLPLVMSNNVVQNQAQTQAQVNAMSPTATDVTVKLGPGEQVEHTFDTTGRFHVYDIDNPDVKSMVTVEPDQNHAPVTYPVTVTVGMNDHAEINLAFEATSDPDDDILTFSLEDAPTHGNATIITDTLIYTPTTDYTGNDTLAYQADDGQGERVEGQIHFVVLSPTKPPRAADRIVTIEREETTTVDLSTLVDNPEGHPLTYMLALDGEYGVASVDSSTLTYQHTIVPTNTEVFTDSVIYAVTNDQSEIAEGSIIIQVVSDTLDLIANDRVVPLYVNESKTVDLTNLVENAAGGELSFGIHNTLPVSFDVHLQESMLSFTPQTDFNGVAALTYVVTNTNGIKGEGQVIFDVIAPYIPEPQVETNRPINLVIEPNVAMFTEKGETQTFTLHAYNGHGEEVMLNSNITWITVTQDLSQSLRIDQNPSNPNQVTVTSLGNIGYAQIKALWGGIPSSSATVTCVELRPGVVIVPDSAVRNEVEFQLPPELEALPTLSERLAWLRAQDPDYLLPEKYRAVLDPTQVDSTLQEGMLVTSSGAQPVFGKVLSTQAQGDDIEIIYETVPITDVIANMRLKAEYGPEDVLGEEDMAEPAMLQHMQGNHVHSLSRDSAAGLAFSDSTTFGKTLSESKTIPCKIRGMTIPGCSLKIKVSVDFSITVDVKISILESSHFIVSANTNQTLTIEYEFDINTSAELTSEDVTLYSGTLPIPYLPFFALMPELSAQLEGKISVAEENITFKGSNEISCNQEAGISTRSEPWGKSSCTGKSDFESNDLSLNGHISAKVITPIKLGVGVPYKKVFLLLAKVGISKRVLAKMRTRLEKYVNVDIEAGLILEPQATLTITYKPDQQDLKSLDYGSGTYEFSIDAEVKAYAKFTLKATFETDIWLFGWTKKIEFDIIDIDESIPEKSLGKKNFFNRKYPSGIGKDDGSSNEQQPPDDVCKKDGPDNYEDEFVKIECKTEKATCETPGGGNRTKYYRKDTPKGKAKRSFTFKEGDWLDHVTDVAVALIGEKTVKEGDTCKTEKISTPEPVGKVTGSGANWKWTWDDIPVGHYKLASFTIPKWFKFLHFHLDEKNKDIFEVQVGDPCSDEEDEWKKVDTDGDCDDEEDNHRSPDPGGGGGGGGCLPGECESWHTSLSQDDPHNVTFDGIPYTTFSLGEFIYARHITDTDGFEMQVRQEVLEGWSDETSFNTAAAVRTDGHIFEVHQVEKNTSNREIRFLIDGRPVDLPVGYYRIGATIIKVSPSRVAIWAKPTAPAKNDVQNDTTAWDDITVWTRGSDTLEQFNITDENTLLVEIGKEAGLKINVSWDPETTHPLHGMLGSMDNDPSNDFRDQAGNEVHSLEEFFNAWRNTNRDTSLFTYEAGQGPETFNITRTVTIPGRDELEGLNSGPNYIQQVTELLTGTCGVEDMTTISDAFIVDTATELWAGRTPQNLLEYGLCSYERVDKTKNTLIGFNLYGQVTLKDHPEVDIPGTRVIVKAIELGYKKLCDTATFEGGTYSCGLTDYPDAYSDTLTLRYEVRGRGAPVFKEVSIEPPEPGKEVQLEQNLEVAPDTVLHLTGRLLDPQGMPLPNGKIRTISPSALHYTADEQGMYSFYLPLPDGITKGDIVYEAASVDLSTYGKLTKSFELDTTGIVQIEQDISTKALPVPENVLHQASERQLTRQIIFTGAVHNQLAQDDGTLANTGIAGAQVTIEGDGLNGGICTTTTNNEGEYRCETNVFTTTTFTAHLQVDSLNAPGQTIEINEDEIPAPGSSIVKTTDVSVSPTTLFMRGTITDPDGTIIPASTVHIITQPAADGTIFNATAEADAQGQYAFYLPLPETTGKITATLSYLTLNGKNLSVKVLELDNLSGSLQEGTLTEIQQDLQFSGYTIALSGRVRNGFVQNTSVGVPGATVRITHPANGVLCETVTDDQGSYACDAFVEENDAFVASYTVSGRGNVTEEVLIDPSLAAVGSRYQFIRDLTVKPTTLHLTGIATDIHGNPVVGSNINIVTGNNGGSARVDGQGQYNLYLILDNDVTTDTVTLSLQYTNVVSKTSTSFRTSIPFTVSSGQQKTLQQDIQLDIAAYNPETASRVTFSGEVRNQNGEGAPLSNATIVIQGTGASAGLGTICQTTTNYQGVYICDTIIQAESPLEVAFAVYLEGTLIGSPTSNTFDLEQGLEENNQYTQELIVAPTTVKLSGRVVDATDVPMSEAVVHVTSPHDVIAQTDEQGDFEVFVPLPEGVVDGTIRYEVTYRNAGAERTETFASIEPGKMTEIDPVTIKVPFVSRYVKFSGIVNNTLVPDGKPIPNTQVVIKSPSGQLCETSTSYGEYSCYVEVATSSAFDVEYTFSGDWGSTTASATVAEGKTGTTTEVEQNVDVAPTTIHMTGIVRDASNTPIEGAYVDVKGATILSLGGNSTNAEGEYSLYAVVDENVDAGSLDFTVRVNYLSFEVKGIEFSSLNPNTLNSLTQDIGYIEFEGTISNALVPELTLQQSSEVEIVSANGRVCMDSLYNGAYHCIAGFDESMLPLDLEYRISGLWGSEQFNHQIKAADITSDGRVSKDMAVSPTTLHLTGILRNAAGTAVADRSIRVSVGDSSDYGITDSEGKYSLYLVLEENVTEGNVRYSVSQGGYYDDDLYTRKSFRDLTPNALNTLEHDISFIAFKGAVTNTHMPDKSVYDTKVTISSSDNEQLCEDYISSSGEYDCIAIFTSSLPFEIQYAISGGWGSASFEDTVTSASLDEDGNFVKDMTISPTMLQLTGVVYDAAGNPVAGKEVYVHGEGVHQDDSASTNDQGEYSLSIVLDEGIQEGELKYTISTGNGSVSLSRSFSNLTLNTVNELANNFTYIAFNGVVSNALVDGMTLYDTTVTVSIGNEQLCSAFNGNYSCAAEFTSSLPVDITYGVSGDWGNASFDATVTAADLDSDGSFANDMTVSPTTIELTGIVYNAADMPIENIDINAYGDVVAQSAWNTTDNDGQYSLFIVLNENTTTGDLTYSIDTSGGYLRVTRPFDNLTPNVLNNIEHNFKFIAFEGTISNELVPDTYLHDSTVAISNGDNQLCNDDTYSGRYRCVAELNTTLPLNVQYDVSGDWGSKIANATVTADDLDSDGVFAYEVSASPTVLHLTGVLYDATGTPATDKSISVFGGIVAQRGWSYTNDQGEYDLYVVLNEDVTEGDLNYTISTGNDNSFVATRSFNNLSANAVNELANDFTYVSFKGKVSNELVPGSLPSCTVSIIADDETLCEEYFSGYSPTYNCAAELKSVLPLNVQYEVDWDGGSAPFNGLVSEATIDDDGYVVQDMSIEPTMLHLTGILYDATGTPVADRQITVDKDTVVSWNSSSTTDEQGAYSFYAIVYEDITDSSFTYKVDTGDSSLEVASSFSNLVPQTVNELSKDITYISLKGTVGNANVPDFHVEGTTVTIATGSNYMCSDSVYENEYSCVAELDATLPLALQYGVSGNWGCTIFDATIEANSLTSEGDFVNDMEVSPTMLHLTGKLYDATGALAIDKQVSVSSESIVEGSSATTDEQGQYSLYVLVKEGVTEGELGYRVAGTSLATRSFSNLTLNSVNELTNDFTYIAFEGTVSNALVEGMKINGATVTIKANSDQLCEGITSYSGKYHCATEFNGTLPVEVEYEVVGDWGNTNLNANVTTSAFNEGSFAKDISVSPTTLHLTGVIRNTTGVPASDVSINAFGDTITQSTSGYTDEQGQYYLYAIVKEGTTNGSLDYTVNYYDQIATRAFDDLTPGTLNDLSNDFSYITFKGSVSNALVPQLNMENTTVTVKSGGNQLCADTRYNYNSGNYECTAEFNTTLPFDVQYEVHGAWGSATFNATVTAATINEDTFTQDMSVAPTTLHITGFLRDTNGTPLSRRISFSGETVAQTDSDYANDEGMYSVYLVINEGITSGELTYKVGDETGTLSYSATNASLTELERDIEISLSEVTEANLCPLP